MTGPQILIGEADERRAVFTRRAFAFGGAAAAGLAALAARLGVLQLVEARRYATLSRENEFRLRLIAPPRGLIIDRAGAVLADSRPEFHLYISREPGVDVGAVLERLKLVAPPGGRQWLRISQDLADAPEWAPLTVAENLSWDEFARVSVCEPELPGVTADVGSLRVYPSPAAFAHVIGYVSKVSRRDLAATGPNSDPILLDPDFRIGEAGLERTYDLPLRGKAGYTREEVDAHGRVVRANTGGGVAPKRGETLGLTLDADVQKRALEVFGAESGAAVMMDCRTGDLLCLFSAPSFDANRFVAGLTRAEYQTLADYNRKPLLNKAVGATYPPGSTFKTMVALAALARGIPPTTVHVCVGRWAWGGRVWHCDEAHGALDMGQAIVRSCDIYFYQLALQIGGPDPIAAVARRFGLGRTYDIGVPGQHRGLVPTRAYKRRYFPNDPVWHPGETPSLGIGQGYVNVNALQQCVLCARLANGRQAVEPRLVRAIGASEMPRPSPGALRVDPAHVTFVQQAMAAVVTNGTAAGQADLGLGPVTMAGKTGTAQTRSYRGGRGEHGAAGGWAARDDAWFIAFAPTDEPRYALSVLVEHGGWGASAAAPRAREIMRVALLKDPQIRRRIILPWPATQTVAAAGDGAGPPRLGA
jgi:penicillin-binding protein 2